jgi:agmatine deiminase
MPAEWEPHAATWLSWPHKEASWPGRYDLIPPVFLEIVRLLSLGEVVHINVNDDAMRQEVRVLLECGGVDLSKVHLHLIPTNDAWCRDHGPTFLVRDREGGRDLAVVDWIFNSWGGKYPPFDLDDEVPLRIAEFLNVPCFRPGMVMEGGALDTDGSGGLLTTESCLLNPNRNPQMSRAEIEAHLHDYLGVDRILWLGSGIAGDDTDGHVDDLARFVAADTIVTVDEPDPADENHLLLADNLRRLYSMRSRDGRPFVLVKLPMPPPLFVQGQRVPCSYANFYIANHAVLVPIFDCDADEVALEILRPLFPGRSVVGIRCRDLVWGLGALHCVTQQQPVSWPPPGQRRHPKERHMRGGAHEGA